MCTRGPSSRASTPRVRGLSLADVARLTGLTRAAARPARGRGDISNDQRSARHESKRLRIAQDAGEIAGRDAGMLAHQALGADAFVSLDRVNDVFVLVLRHNQIPLHVGHLRLS